MDHDIRGYWVYLGKTASLTDLQETTAKNNVQVNLDAGTVYYWKVIIVHDTSSESPVFDFKIQ